MNRFFKLNYFVSNMCISYETAICSNRLLSCLGTDASSVQTYNYIGKDIFGQVLGLFFVKRYGHLVDKIPKKYLILSHTIQQTSLGIEYITPLVDNTMFLPITIMTSAGNNIAWTSFGAFNAKIIQKYSSENKNIGEVYSDLTILATISSSIGMGLGLLVDRFKPEYVIPSLVLVGLLRVWSINRAFGY